MTNTLKMTFSEIAFMMEVAAFYLIECDVPFNDELAERMDESTSGEFESDVKLLMDTYVHLQVINMIKEIDAAMINREMLCDRVKQISSEEIVHEYFYKWCNNGDLNVLCETNNSATIVKQISFEEIVREYFYKWCNNGDLNILSETNDIVTIVNNDGELDQEILFKLFKVELFKLLT